MLSACRFVCPMGRTTEMFKECKNSDWICSSVVDGCRALLGNLVPKEAGQASFWPGVQAGQGEEQQVQLIN